MGKEEKISSMVMVREICFSDIETPKLKIDFNTAASNLALAGQTLFILFA